MGAHLGHPLGHQALRSNDQYPLDQSVQFEFAKNETSLDGLAQTDFIGQQVTHTIPGDRAGQGPDLVRKRYYRGFDGRKRDILRQGVGHARGRGDVGDAVSGARSGVLQGSKPGCRHTDYGVASGQPHPAGRLAPKSLGLDDLTELPMVRAEIPAVCINPHPLVPWLQRK